MEMQSTTLVLLRKVSIGLVQNPTDFIGADALSERVFALDVNGLVVAFKNQIRAAVHEAELESSIGHRIALGFKLMLPLFCGVLSSLLTRPFCAVPRTSVARIA